MANVDQFVARDTKLKAFFEKFIIQPPIQSETAQQQLNILQPVFEDLQHLSRDKLRLHFKKIPEKLLGKKVGQLQYSDLFGADTDDEDEDEDQQNQFVEIKQGEHPINYTVFDLRWRNFEHKINYYRICNYLCANEKGVICQLY